VSVVAALRGRKNPIPRSWRIPVWCAAIAIVTSTAAVVATISVSDWNPTVLVRMAQEQELAPLARAADPDFKFVHYHGRGDGVAYYAIARDPLARGDEHDRFIWPAYRYGHPGYSWLAWALTLGKAAFIPYAFVLLNLVAMGVAGAAASLVARELGYTEWAGLAIALNPGLVYSTTIDTSEPVAAALLLVVLLLWLRGRWRVALPLIAALCFMKEWFVLVPVGLGLWELLRFARTRRRELRRRSAALVLSIVPFGFWYLYVLLRFDEWPASPTRDFLQLPPTGWIQTMRGAAERGTGTFDGVVTGHATVPLLAVAGAALAFGAFRALRLRTPVDAVYLAFMPVVFAMNKWGLMYAKDMIRELAIPLVLLPAVVAGYASVPFGMRAGREPVAAQGETGVPLPAARVTEPGPGG
jgi:hypothetical protein